MALQQLTYVSTATRPLDEQEMTHLVCRAKEKNDRLGVSGMLLFNGLNFMQTLEGEGPTIDDLMRSIAADGRHFGVVIVSHDQIDTRAFDGWGMRYTRTAISPLAETLTSGGKAQVEGLDLLETLPPHLAKIYASFNSIAGISA